MARDTQGNDLDSVEVVLGGGIRFAPYDEANVITPEMIAASKTPEEVADALPEIFKSPESGVGLITSDGGPQDARDADDATEFYQSGYSLNADPSLTTAFTIAENNELTRRMTIGEPDEYGVYHVSDILQNDKWIAYQEESIRGAGGKVRVRRRAGVIQLTGNEPNQSERGVVKGSAWTATWQADSLFDPNAKYLESYYEPASAKVAVTGVTVTPDTTSVKNGSSVTLTATVAPGNASDKTVTWSADDSGAKVTLAPSGTTCKVTGKADSGTVNVTCTTKDGSKTDKTVITLQAAS